MKIGLLTLPVETGYGSILQAVALHDYLLEEGHEVILLRRHTIRRDSPIRIIGRFIKKYLFRKPIAVRISKKERDEFPIITQNTQPFIEAHLSPYSEIFYSSKQMRKINNLNLDAIIVGSDQVWRPDYVQKIEDYFLYQISDSIIKISYAASFGTDEWLFSKAETNSCREALSKFRAISVREKQTVKMCYEHLHQKAEFVLDPTLLHDCNYYLSFVEKHNPRREGKLCAYLLNYDKMIGIAQKYAKSLATEIVNPHSKVEDKNADVKDRIVPSVSDWIDSIYSSQAVCTDSFHGMVFSIIFKRPFVVYINKERGAARFISLLQTLELEDRIVDESTDFNTLSQIDWVKVEYNLNKMKKKSTDFLKLSLGEE